MAPLPDGLTVNRNLDLKGRENHPWYRRSLLCLVFWIYFQVNPTNVGKRREDVELDDGATPIATVHRSLTIFP